MVFLKMMAEAEASLDSLDGFSENDGRTSGSFGQLRRFFLKMMAEAEASLDSLDGFSENDGRTSGSFGQVRGLF
ncbi:hypothetical protein [Mesobacillus jeotgali]|uniref:hypothetical protein n=1 Tax=Mesobacillus jeotgali TaxID=129985 RepID=UPI0009A6B418|nr:hypothetical protein [Mesobacillus jeotgali]